MVFVFVCICSSAHPLILDLFFFPKMSTQLTDMSCVQQVTELATVKRPQERAYALQRWHETGGVMIIGYEMYRNLTQGRNIKSKKLKETFKKTLVDPGMVLCNSAMCVNCILK